MGVLVTGPSGEPFLMRQRRERLQNRACLSEGYSWLLQDSLTVMRTCNPPGHTDMARLESDLGLGRDWDGISKNKHATLCRREGSCSVCSWWPPQV